MNRTRYTEMLARLVPEVEMEGKKILVTGASGLIGSCLVDVLMLAGRGNEVYALGRSRARLEARFAEYQTDARFHPLVQDVCQPLPEALAFDAIFHGASNADPLKYATQPVETITTNLTGAQRILEHAAAHPHCRALLMSTFEVYGRLDRTAYAEGDYGLLDFNALRACYPESKRLMEVLARSYREEYRADVVIARLGSIYGPTMAADDSKAQAQFLRNALQGQDIVMKSEGKQRRTYCHVADAVSGLLAVMQRGESGEAYNVAPPQGVATIAEVAETLAQLAGTRVVYALPSQLERKGYSAPQDSVLDGRKLAALGWKSHFSLREGLRNCLQILQ